MKESVLDRFVDRVIVGVDCWEWRGAHSRGYGRFAKSHRELISAHRFAYEWMVSPVPAEMQLDHLCRNRGCVNPSHLEVVTCRENLLRSDLTHAGRNASKTHCKRGHEFTMANTWRDRSGRRYCRTCANLRQNARRAALRASQVLDGFQKRLDEVA